MKKITPNADEDLIKRAQRLARALHRTSNVPLRNWLLQFSAQSHGTQEVDRLMKRLRHVRAGRSFSRDEMNER